MNPVIFPKAPVLDSLSVLAVLNAPFERLTTALAIVAVPVEAPKFKVVAAPKASIVVALVLKTSKSVVPVVTEVVKFGEVPNTATPEPVSSESEASKSAEAPVETKLEEPSVKTALLPVNPEKLIVPEEVIPVAPVIAPAAEISKVGVFKKLVNPAPPELVIKIASVTTVVPAAVVSALSSLNRAATALSVALAVSWFWTWKAYSVLPATVGLLVKLRLMPV